MLLQVRNGKPIIISENSYNATAKFMSNDSGPDESASSTMRPARRGMRLPFLSGKSSAAVLFVCLAITAVMILPLIRKVPPWIDFEIIIAIWWVVWTIALAAVLNSGRRVADDHILGTPRNWLSGFGKKSQDQDRPRRTDSDWGCAPWYWLDFGGFDEGCLLVLGVIAALVVAGVGIWLLLEVVIPGLAFVAYFLIRGMLARVANDDHGCQGKLVRAIAWGAVWATLYTAPLAFIVWLVHAVHKPPGG
jgi:hypothetical protein